MIGADLEVVFFLSVLGIILLIKKMCNPLPEAFFVYDRLVKQVDFTNFTHAIVDQMIFFQCVSNIKVCAQEVGRAQILKKMLYQLANICDIKCRL